MRVHSGPFQGMHYTENSQGSCYIPKLLGVYERELHDVLENLIAWGPDLVIDAGAAEGYYAVGLARRLPQSRIMAFEMEEGGRALLEQMVLRNGVSDRVEVRGKCEPQDVEGLAAKAERPLVVCDTEGYETELLDPKAASSLRKAAILVELHDFIQPGTYELLSDRFAGSHLVTRIWQEPRDEAEFPFRNLAVRIMPRYYRQFPLSEWRPVRMSWLLMLPNTPTKVGA